MEFTCASFYAGLITLAIALITKFLYDRNRCENSPPVVPGLPLIGNLHQLKEKKPHQTFAKWGEIYGPIYTIKTGASTLLVLNSTEVAKEAMVTRFSSITTRKLSKALTLLTSNKSMVATSDYGEFHKMVKRCILKSILGPDAQKRQRCHRDTLINNVLNILHSELKDDPLHAINFREPFKWELFQLSLKQTLGEDVESIFVEELGKEITKNEMYNILVVDPMMGAIDVDWRDFFPYLRWIPNRRLENRIQQMVTRKMATTRALIEEQKKRISHGDERDCYVDYLLKENSLTEEQLTTLVWEAIIEASDTTMVATEWAMFELARNPEHQDRLYCEVQDVCGSEEVKPEHLSQMPFLNAVFHETLRRYSPAPVIPIRFAHEDTQIGGYNIKAGTEIAINLYACNMNTKTWPNPEEWNPNRFQDSKLEHMDLYKTMAFGAGKRTCAGSLQAMLISCTSIARLVQEFEWKLKEGEEADMQTVQLTTQKLHPMHAYIKPRQRSVSSFSSTH